MMLSIENSLQKIYFNKTVTRACVPLVMLFSDEEMNTLLPTGKPTHGLTANHHSVQKNQKTFPLLIH